MSCEPRIALVLGSGGLRGLAHVGVLSVLEENNIKPDLITGCSIGSLIGALICAGHDSQTLMKLARALGRKSWIEFVADKLGFVASDKVYEIVTILTQNRRIEELDIPFAAVATDLTLGKEHVFYTGKAADAVCSSISVPGLFVPYRYGGHQMVDGALINPTPVNIAKKMGADLIIAVDLAFVSTVEEVNNFFDVILRSLDIMEKGLHHYNGLEQSCDVLIRPQLNECRVTDFQKIEECYEAGRLAAEKALPEIKNILATYSLK
ncbi:MAG TPA: patatin-like phospholipase family protein [Candidatus Avacidaminococcus intestinavium]|uniref:Patatin-like phospholipase family protein n=1 Tax=Candidatus Avacidaminococcus intestinavium TaxID=2840684 RepID=A0A9D1SLJ2_9FIRM|nr:patatin-like phospholipase family protein [Candidatus Avacidaminococcus intestinavium]